MGSSLEATEEDAGRWRHFARNARGALHAGHHQHRQAQGKMYASIYVQLVDRKGAPAQRGRMSTVLRERLQRIPGITVTHVGFAGPWAGKSRLSSRCRARTLPSWNA